jgi:serine/threonine protein phosphatase PrpC
MHDFEDPQSPTDFIRQLGKKIVADTPQPPTGPNMQILGDGAGTLLTFMLTKKGEAAFGNMGDTPLHMLVYDPAIKDWHPLLTRQLTQDHTPDNPRERKRLMEAGHEITRNEGDVARVGGLAITRSLGNHYSFAACREVEINGGVQAHWDPQKRELVEAQQGPINVVDLVKQGMTVYFLGGTDGILKHPTGDGATIEDHKQLLKNLHENFSPENKADMLLKSNLARGSYDPVSGNDDATALLVRVGPEQLNETRDGLRGNLLATLSDGNSTYGAQVSQAAVTTAARVVEQELGGTELASTLMSRQEFDNAAVKRASQVFSATAPRNTIKPPSTVVVQKPIHIKGPGQ